jgi:hypothetical protein
VEPHLGPTSPTAALVSCLERQHLKWNKREHGHLPEDKDATEEKISQG